MQGLLAWQTPRLSLTIILKGLEDLGLKGFEGWLSPLGGCVRIIGRHDVEKRPSHGTSGLHALDSTNLAVPPEFCPLLVHLSTSIVFRLGGVHGVHCDSSMASGECG